MMHISNGPAITGEDPVGGNQKFCLKWNNFGRNVTTSFKVLLENEEFVDISLTAEGKTIKAHRVVLSASSFYFKNILQGVPSWQHPVIFLRDVPFSDLQGIVEFIYHGEVSVDQECLPSFLKTAQVLRVKGLTEDTANNVINKNNNDKMEEEIDDDEDIEDEEEDEEEEEEEPSLPWVKTNMTSDNMPKLESHTPQQQHHHQRKSANPKKKGPKVAPCPPPPQRLAAGTKRETDEESEPGVFAGEIDDREEEEVNAVPSQQDQERQKHLQEQQQMMNMLHLHATSTSLQHFMSGPAQSSLASVLSNVVQQHQNAGKNLLNEDKDDEIGGGDGGMVIDEDATTMHLMDSPAGFSQGKNCASVNNSNGTNGNANSTQKKTCPYCFQKLSWHALSRHVRDMHKNKSGVVTCKFCGKMFRNKNSLGCHVWRFHKTKQDGSGKHQQDSSGGQLLSNDHQSMETVKQEASE